MPNLTVSIDQRGNITCDDLTTTKFASVTWDPVTGGSITAITPGTPSPFSTPPAKNDRGLWTATVNGSGTYTLSADTSLGGRATPKTPRITVIAP